MTPCLQITRVSKSFGATRALDGVDLQLWPGEVHALIGENGAGKSTLMKMLTGVYRPDAGSIHLQGRPYQPHNPWQARRAGVAMIYQELSLALHLTVEENILLGKEPTRWGWIQPGAGRALVRQALGILRHGSLPLTERVGRLTLPQQQVVEIARALVERPRILIMDEPTSSLSQQDAENLFQVIDQLRRTGVSIVYISHFLEECQRVCQRYTVLRDGRRVAGGKMADTTASELVRQMVGREMAEIYPRIPRALGPPMLTLRAVAGRTKPRRASLTLHEGEILGLAGLVGAGRTETVRTCFGLDTLQSGTVQVRGVSSRRASPTLRLRQGIGLLSENRKEEGLMLNRSLADNLTLTRFRGLTTWGWIRREKQRQATRHWMEALDLRAGDPDQPVITLSGGNQQKAALGRLLHHEAEVLLLDEPTRGIDVGSKAQIYRLMGQWAAQGRAILFISSYLPELLGVCDRIGVMCRGILSEVRPVSEWTQQSIMAAAIGQSDAAAPSS